MTLRFHPLVPYADQALWLEPCIRHSLLRRRRPRHVPVAFAADTGDDRRTQTDPEFRQIADLRARLRIR
jgi:hypothetical protein